MNILVLSCHFTLGIGAWSFSETELTVQETFLTQLNMGVFACRAMTAVPSLKSIELKIDTDTSRRESYWRIADNDGTAELIHVPLEDD